MRLQLKKSKINKSLSFSKSHSTIHRHSLMPFRTELLSSYSISLYRWFVIAIGAVILFFSLQSEQTKSIFTPTFFFLLVFTAIVGARVSIKLTRYNGTITVADTFIFLALLLWGVPAAIVTAIVESLVGTAKIARRVTTYLFNASVSVIGVWVTSQTLTAIFAAEPSQLVSVLPDGSFALAVSFMGLTHYLVIMTVTALLQVLKMTASDLRAWMRQYYLWSCITFFVAAATAGVVVKFVGHLNFFSFLVVAPIIFLVYFTYQTYLKNLDALQESEGRFRSSFDYATVGMALLSTEGTWLQVNKSLRNLLGRESNELLKQHYREVIHEDDVIKVENYITALLEDKTPTFQDEVRLVRADGETVWTLMSASTARDSQNAIRYLILQTQDVTLRKKAEEQLLYDASHDALTGLHNRASYTAQLKSALIRAKRNKDRTLAVLFLDLDGFKMINDSLGHAIGDELLKATAGRLLECVRSMDTVARLGGDEFTILLEDMESITQAVHVAERIQYKLSKPFQFAGQEIFINTSIGIATSEILYADAGEMLRDADAAMYQAKARGKGCHVLFDHEMHANATRQLRLANDLRRAAERNEFVLHYQVMQSFETEEIYGFEALIRWQHPIYGLLMPGDFIPIAEENGLTSVIDRWALQTACRQLREWQLENPDFNDLVISVNISTKQFAQTSLFDFVYRVLHETSLPPRCLQLEVTESAMVQNLKNTARILAELNNLGVGISLDDFGTGYSSLSYLHELPIDTLKIDRSFISRLNDEGEGAAIVRAIIVLARNLRIKVVAEGVETLDQMKSLRGMGCDYGQGYLFSRPIASQETLKLLTAAHQHHSQVANRKRSQLRLVSGS